MKLHQLLFCHPETWLFLSGNFGQCWRCWYYPVLSSCPQEMNQTHYFPYQSTGSRISYHQDVSWHQYRNRLTFCLPHVQTDLECFHSACKVLTLHSLIWDTCFLQRFGPYLTFQTVFIFLGTCNGAMSCIPAVPYIWECRVLKAFSKDNHYLPFWQNTAETSSSFNAVG